MQAALEFIVTGPARDDDTPEARRSNRYRLRAAVARAEQALAETIRSQFVPPGCALPLPHLLRYGDLMKTAAQICVACDRVFQARNLARHCSPACVSRSRNRRLWRDAHHPELRVQAYRVYQRALSAGHLTRPMFCDRCRGTGIIQGHHEDYAHPLEVAWLCARCHLARHLGREDGTLEMAV